MWQLCPRLKPGWDIVIVARSKLEDASSGQVQVALEELVSRVGLIGGPPVEQAPTGGSLF
jgi:RNase P protein component